MKEMIQKHCKKSMMKEIDEVKGILTLAVNQIGIEDRQHDISAEHSFDKTIRPENFAKVKWFYNHDWNTMLGCPISAEVKDGFLCVTGQLNLRKQLGQDILSDYLVMAENGKTLEHSIGVIPVIRDKNDNRIVKEWNLLEYSTLSSWGACPNTHLVDIKNATKDEVVDALAMLESAVTKRYSDARLEGIESQITMLRKALAGELIVKCPSCGTEFNYAECNELSFSDDVVGAMLKYADMLTQGEDVAVDSTLADMMSALKHHDMDVTAENIADMSHYVHCPQCYDRIYKADAIIDETAETEATATGIADVECEKVAQSTLRFGMMADAFKI